MGIRRSHSRRDRGIWMDFHRLLMPVPESAVFRMEGYHVWCGSMIEGNDGLYYLLFSRWPEHLGHAAWVTHSEVAVAVADRPLGPYTFRGVALRGGGEGAWDADVVHNPTVIKADGRYYMYYMGTKGPHVYETTKPSFDDSAWWEYRNNQRVGVAVADHPAGPWRRFDRPCIDVVPGSFDHLMTSNPSVAQGADGQIYMVYKAVGDGPMPRGGAVICGVAVAEHPLGPFRKQPEPIMVNPEEGWSVEDPFIWYQDDRFYALAKDFQGYFTGKGKGSVALFESMDGICWQAAACPFAFDKEIVWQNGAVQRMEALERPQIWMKDGKPAVLFCAAAAEGDRKRDHAFNVHIPLRQ